MEADHLVGQLLPGLQGHGPGGEKRRQKQQQYNFHKLQPSGLFGFHMSSIPFPSPLRAFEGSMDGFFKFYSGPRKFFLAQASSASFSGGSSGAVSPWVVDRSEVSMGALSSNRS